MTRDPNESTRRHEEALKSCFDGCKHMTTLSAAAAAAILVASYQEGLIYNSLLTVSLFGLSMSILASLVGLLVPAKSQIKHSQWDLPVAFASLYISVTLFTGGALTPLVGSLGLPNWVEFLTGVIVTLPLILVVLSLLLPDSAKREQ
jgi:hypothetical protein